MEKKKKKNNNNKLDLQFAVREMAKADLNFQKVHTVVG